MIYTSTVLLLCVVGVLCIEREFIGKLPHRPKPRPSLDIFHGKNTSVSKHPYIASLTVNGDEFGAAVILNKNWLLTTGYTVSLVLPSDLQFRVGSNYYDKEGQVLNASKVVVHPNYTGSWDWNIAVVKTNKPIKLGKDVQPIKLGTKKLKGGDKAFVAGWGEYDSTGDPSEKLLGATVTVFDWAKCKQTYGGYLTKRIMWTLDKKVAPCYYDYGDPIVVKGAVYGLFVGGYGCDPNSDPVLYTDVPSLQQWVQSAIKSDESDKI